MTIQKALKSGKEIRRKGWDGRLGWMRLDGHYLWMGTFGMDRYVLTSDDILATDWETNNA